MICALLLIHRPSFHTTPKQMLAPAMADTLPPMPKAPEIKNGWLGTYTYTVKLKGSGNQPKPYSYYANFHRVHTGFVEFTREVRGAIRVNQPDKYNKDRWESWLSNGTKKSWNYINDTLKAVSVITSDACCRTPHDHLRVIRAGDAKNWKEGFTHNMDLQIDHMTGTYILSVPLATTDAQDHEQWKVRKDVVSKNNYLRDVDETRTMTFKTYQQLNEADTIMGTFQKGQKEIVINRNAPFIYEELLWHDDNGKAVFITPKSTGTIEFKLVLKRID
jgi:hypothetical protein